MLLFIKNEENVLDEAERARALRRDRQWFSEIGRDGKLRGGEELQPSNTATTIRFQDGKPLVTDGPFMESKENVAGFVTDRRRRPRRGDRHRQEVAAEGSGSSRSARRDPRRHAEPPGRLSEPRDVRSTVNGPTAEAMNAVFRAEVGLICGSLVRITGDFDLAEDLVQDAVVAALQTLAGRRCPGAPGRVAAPDRTAARDRPVASRFDLSQQAPVADRWLGAGRALRSRTIASASSSSAATRRSRGTPRSR